MEDEDGITWDSTFAGARPIGIMGEWGMTFITSKSVFEDKVKEYFDSLHTVQWARAFDLSREDTRQIAVDFVMDLCQKLNLVVFMTSEEEDMLSDEEISDDPLLRSMENE